MYAKIDLPFVENSNNFNIVLIIIMQYNIFYTTYLKLRDYLIESNPSDQMIYTLWIVTKTTQSSHLFGTS